MTIDISNFYLMKPLKFPEYILIHVRDIQNEIIKEDKLKEKRTQNVWYILSPTAACMAYHSPDYYPMSSLKINLTNAATNKSN